MHVPFGVIYAGGDLGHTVEVEANGVLVGLVGIVQYGPGTWRRVHPRTNGERSEAGHRPVELCIALVRLCRELQRKPSCWNWQKSLAVSKLVELILYQTCRESFWFMTLCSSSHACSLLPSLTPTECSQMQNLIRWPSCAKCDPACVGLLFFSHLSMDNCWSLGQITVGTSCNDFCFLHWYPQQV